MRKIWRNNVPVSSHSETKINSTKEEIKVLTKSLAKVQVAKKNKKEFNEIGSLIISYGKTEEAERKTEEVQREIEELQQKYDRDMQSYELKERYLKASVIMVLFSFRP